MKKIILALSLVIIFTACDIAESVGLSPSKSELYAKADSFVESLQTTYKSYGMLGGMEHATSTSDGLYRLMPTGRLINIKIQEVVSDEEYESLRASLESHFKNDSRVNSVYICGGGTIMIDCRN